MQMLAGHVSEIIRQTNNLEKSFKYQSKGLESFITIADKHISNAAKEIISNHKVINEMAKDFKTLEHLEMLSVELNGKLARQVKISGDLIGRLYGLIDDIGDRVHRETFPFLTPNLRFKSYVKECPTPA